MAGRPTCTIELSLNNPLRCMRDITKYCQQNESLKANMILFANSLLDCFVKSETKSTQTNNDETSLMQNICELSENFTSYEKSFLLSNIWSKIHPDDQVKIIFMLYCELEQDQQENMFAFLGDSLNATIYDESKKNCKQAKDLDIGQLREKNKSDFYKNCDKRVTSFIDSLTARQVNTNSDCVNFKYNAYENILKARNSKFISEVGLKEHMVSYLASGKAIHNTQVFSKQGGKGTRPVLERVLKNSEDALKFKAPEILTLFFSFDNIQTLLKSHRVGGEHQQKILAVVVCSILCLAWGEESYIQFATKNCPAYWYSNYKFEPKNNVFIESLSSSTLKKCLDITAEEAKIFNDFFENDIQDALDFVANDIQENNEDSIDIQTRMSISKRRKLCENNHINDNVKSNRKVCDRQYCKANLKMNAIDANKVDLGIKKPEEKIDKETSRANLYMNVENVIIDDVPEEFAVGASAVNPNKKERLSKVLDEIIEVAGMKNKFSVKLVLSENTVTKVINSDPEFRKFVVVSADGLPYKALIELIKDTHTCAICGKKFDYLAEMTDHMKETQHREYFQTYGNILPNIGQFHYALTMLRSLVKLTWDIDYQGLVKSIFFDTPKGLFMQQKVTDFRKCKDTNRTVRKAKLRELVTPFVKYAKENELPVKVEQFLQWKEDFVKCETYLSVFQIEKHYGTSFLLYHAAIRANNSKIADIAKKYFSPLFHVNKHPNYSIMDIHIDYLDQTMAANVPELKKYLDVRKSTNFTRQKYAGEPHDERHEEYNKRGLNMQNIKSVDDFKQSFQLVDHYVKMKESLFDDYDIKIHGGNIITNQDYEENISRMRIAMRKQNYLTKPQNKKPSMSLEKNELNPELSNIVNVAMKQRQDDVLNVIRHNDFSKGYSTTAKFQVLKNDANSKLGMNYETQLDILIASEENAELRENLTQYCKRSRNHPDFDEEKLVDDILAKNFVFNLD